MKNERILMFNGQILSDSKSILIQYQGDNGYSHRYFDSVDELCEEMEKIAGATTSMGKGVIRDLGEILDREELFSAVRSAKKGELVLVKTQYEVVGNQFEYEKFTEIVRRSPGLVMVGAWTNDFSRLSPAGTPILIW